MIAFDISVLIDSLDEQPVARAFIQGHRDQPLHAPMQALIEAYRGGTRAQGEPGVNRVRPALEFLEPLPFSRTAPDRAAQVEAQLLADGSNINGGDVVVAGVCHGATLVADDSRFENVDGLEIIKHGDD